MAKFKVGETVSLVAGATYLNNKKEVPASVMGLKLYIRDVKANSCVIARAKSGPVLGEVANDYLRSANENVAVIDPYCVRVNTHNLPLYYSFNKNSGVVKRLTNFPLLTIIDEKNGFGKVKVGPGWVELIKVEKLT